MAGIAPQPPAPQPDSQQPPQPGSQGPDNLGDEEGMAPNVSPEEQDQYNQFVAASVALIYDQKPDDPQGQSAQVRPGILKLLDDDHSDLQGILKVDPAQLKQDAEQQGIDPKMFEALVAIASTAVIVIVHIMELAGDQRPADDIVVHGSVAVIAELSEIWMRVNKQSLGEDEVHKALGIAANLYREVAVDKGLIDENALKDEFNQLVAADHAGKLGEISPELEGINKAAEMNMQDGTDPAQSDQQPPADQPPPDQPPPDPSQAQEQPQ